MQRTRPRQLLMEAEGGRRDAEKQKRQPAAAFHRRTKGKKTKKQSVAAVSALWEPEHERQHLWSKTMKRTRE